MNERWPDSLAVARPRSLTITFSLPFGTERRRQTTRYSLKAEVWQNGNKIAVIHAHVEDQQNVVTKAHVKSDHYGYKLFDLSPGSLYSGLILGYLVQGRYRVALD